MNLAISRPNIEYKNSTAFGESTANWINYKTPKDSESTKKVLWRACRRSDGSFFVGYRFENERILNQVETGKGSIEDFKTLCEKYY